MLNNPLQLSWLAIGVALAALAFPVVTPAAQITYDLRAVAVGVLPGDITTDGVLISNGGHTARVLAHGEVVVLQLYAILQGADADLTNDGFVSTHGSFVTDSLTGGLVGTIRGDVLGGPQTQSNNVPGQNFGIAQAGFQINYPNTGAGISVGSSDTGAPSTLPWFQAYSAVNGGQNVTKGQEILIGETTFTLAPGGAFGQHARVNYVPRQFLDGGTAATRRINRILIDNVFINLASDDAQVAVGAGVGIVTEPEPSAISMLLVGSLGLVGFRRSAFRRLSA